ncbi:protein MRVI1 isoform X2 [Denticeps clupeoides]|uniref:protein MRVI1 isoform X2 n=1 Tax=Denticeps clupeoides TaxID=299321 RepID=UPI0010A3A36F|nr:protein MRVI1-like isoform X2 [Denticeps clupeoides]
MSVKHGGAVEPARCSDVDSDEESRHEELMACLDQLSILERLRPSSDDMTEEEVENGFCQYALAFRNDQYTLRERLRAEERARRNAEESLQLELQRGRDALETLKGMCLDSHRNKHLQRLELCLHVLGGTVRRIANASEVLGAAHQEAKTSHAVQLMVAHVESVKQGRARDRAQLDETQRLLQQSTESRGAVVLQKSGKDSQTVQFTHINSPGFLAREPHIPALPHPCLCVSQLAVRRRVNLSTQGQGQEMRKQEQGTKDKSALEEKPGKKLRLEQREPSKSSSGEDCPLVGSRQFASPDVCEGDTLTLEDFPATSPGCCPTHAMAEPGTLTNLIRPPHKSLRRRQRSKTDVCGTSSKGGGPGHDHTPTDGSDLGLRRLLEHWQYHCRWILAYIYITVLGSLVLLAVFFWFLRTPVLWM